MAQHNEARICGFITSKAVQKDKANDGTVNTLMMVRTCIRDNAKYDGRGVFDVQVFYQYNKDEENDTATKNLIEAVEKANEGDFVDITGTCVLLKKGMAIQHVCSSCGKVEEIELKPSIAVVPRYMYKAAEMPMTDDGADSPVNVWESKITNKKIEELRENFAEISNRVTLVGAVLTEPVFFKKVNKETKEKKVSASYMLGVDRHYRVLCPALADATNDSFFVKSIGRTACEDKDHIIASKPKEEGTTLLVDGFIYSKPVYEFKHKCSHCGATTVVKSKVPMMSTAIIPYATEYMTNFNKVEKKEEEE